MTKTTSLDKPKDDAGFSWCLHALNNHATTRGQIRWQMFKNLSKKPLSTHECRARYGWYFEKQGFKWPVLVVESWKDKKKRERMKSWTFYWISSSRRLFFWRITVHTMSLKFLFPTFFFRFVPPFYEVFWRIIKAHYACLSTGCFLFFFDFWSRKNKLVNSDFSML